MERHGTPVGTVVGTVTIVGTAVGAIVGVGLNMMTKTMEKVQMTLFRVQDIINLSEELIIL